MSLPLTIRRFGLVVFSALALTTFSPNFAAEGELHLILEANGQPRANTPVSVPINPPAEWKDAKVVELVDDQGKVLVGQITAAGVPWNAGAKQQSHELHFLIPSLAERQRGEFTIRLSEKLAAAEGHFNWTASPAEGAKPEFIELKQGGRSILRYMCAPLDESNAESRSATFKPYHHVYDPTGKRFLTKGAGGLFPHHRGLFYGFNKITYGDGKQQADTWHCNKNEFQSHEGVIATETGPVLGSHTVKIAWHGQDKAVFAEEQRQMTVFNLPGGTMIEFASLLESKVGKIHLAGDPQHAGFQFRATQDVPDKTAKQTFYIRPDGIGEPGKFRNWPDVKTHINLPWNALSFVVDDQRYTCCYLDRPSNPKESRFSERDYGRFGSYFEYELDTDKPLVLRYRVFLKSGEMTIAEIDRMDADFTNPPQAQLK